MPATHSVPWLELILGAALALWLTLVALLQLGVEPLHAVLWLIVAAIAITGAGIIVIGRERKFGLVTLATAAAIALGVVIGTTDVRERFLPICGDGVCHPSECTAGCGDCSAAQCTDGICTIGIERCDNSPDCACAARQACAPLRADEDPDLKGCIAPRCGDGYCDRGVEGITDCCTDCGCQRGYACQNNACFYQPPEIDAKHTILVSQIAATSLAANPTLTDIGGTPHVFVNTTIQTSVTIARNASVTFSIDDLARDTIPIGDLQQGSRISVPWQMTPASLRHSPLVVTQDALVNLTISISYHDGQGTLRTKDSRYLMTVLGRDRLDAFGSKTFFVTPDDIAIPGGSAREVWERIGARMRYDATRPIGRIRFPVETLASGSGNREEIAVLLASAFQKADLNPALVETGIGTLVRVRDGGMAVILDPARIGQEFNEAIWSGPGFYVEDVDRAWRERNTTAPLRLSQELLPGAQLRVDTERTVTCVCAPVCGPHVLGTGTVTNNGLVAAPVCAVSTVLRNGLAVDERETCTTLAPGEVREFRHGWQGDGSCDPATIRVLFDVRPGAPK